MGLGEGGQDDNFYRTFDDNGGGSTKVDGWTPVMTGDKLEAKTRLRCSKQQKTGGKWVT